MFKTMLVLLPMSWPKGQKKKNSYFKENEIYLKKKKYNCFPSGIFLPGIVLL